MQYQLTPYAHRIEPCAWWDGAFTEDELNILQTKAKNATINAEIDAGPAGNVNKKFRRSQVSWVDNTPETEWIFEKLAHVVSSLNSQFFHFDLTGFGEPLQLTNYNNSEHGMYDWHQDYNAVVSRKLSIVMQLTDPSEYEGGNLQLLTNSTPKSVHKQRGLIVAFPSYVLHQVTPVTQGSRQSLVAWISGPAFK